MKTNKQTPLFESGLLTEQMDTKSVEFKEFQAKLLNISRNRTEEEQTNIELLALKYRIEDYIESEKDELESAGSFLRQYLKVLHIKQKIFANYIGLKPSNLSKLLNGERPINYNLAIVFGKIFNIDPMIWIEIQAKNEMSKLRETNKENYLNYSIKDLVAK
jgi:plasmid maintenance system antidote protein VapI